MKYSLLIMAITSLLLSSCTQTGVNLLNTLSDTGDFITVKNITYGTQPQNKLVLQQVCFDE